MPNINVKNWVKDEFSKENETEVDNVFSLVIKQVSKILTHPARTNFFRYDDFHLCSFLPLRNLQDYFKCDSQ